MVMGEHLQVNSILLKETGLLSDNSSELKTYLAINSIKTVSDLLKFSDNPKGYSKLLHQDVLLELAGFIDLIKQKYFTIPLMTDTYLDRPIKYVSFYGLSSLVHAYGVVGRDGNKRDIYTLINRLGFNDNERKRILYVTEEYLDGRLLIDLLSDAYERIVKNAKANPNDQILCNKLLVILGHYLIIHKDDDKSDFMKSAYQSIAEFGDLLIKKNDDIKKR